MVQGHSYFELPRERPGYDGLLLNMWFLFRFLIAGLCVTLFYTSGGLLALYWVAALRALAPAPLTSPITPITAAPIA